MDLLRLCRLCLKSSGYHSNMFTEIISNKHLYLLINDICELRVFRNDGLPEHICVNCFQSIRSIISFKSRAKETEAALMRTKRIRNMMIEQEEEEFDDTEDASHSFSDHSTLGVNQVFIKEEPIELTESSHEDDRLSEDDAEQTEAQEHDRFGSNLHDSVQDVNSEVINRTLQPEVNLRSFPESICRVEMILPDEDNNTKFKEDLRGNTPTQSFDEEVSLRSSVSIKDEIETEEMIIPGERIHLTNEFERSNTGLQCHDCGEIRDTKEEMGLHIQDAHSITIAEEFALDNEMRRRRRHVCPICERRFLRKHHLIGHMKVHTNEKPYKCNMCDYSYSRNSHLKRHMLSHTGEKPFQCTICGHRCQQRGQLKQHMLVHTGEKPFKCDVCGYKCSANGTLKMHMLVHTGEKPFQCSVCDYRCKRKDNLKTHMLTHTGDKPFQCNICEYRFTQKKHLQQHMYTHTGQKPFQCSFCEYKTSRNDHLRAHMRVHRSK